MERIEPLESASNRSCAVGTGIKLRCKDGYQPEPGNTDVASCRLNGSVGSWVMPTIQCRRCPEPPKIDNGRHEFENPNYPTSVTYHCNSGYDLVGDNVISFQENDTWTGGQNPAKCVKSRCPIPQDFPKDVDMFAVGNLLFSCRNSSHTIIISCFDTGKWQSSPPNCKGCKLDAKYPDGKYNDILPSDGLFPHFTNLKFECHSGHKLIGEPVSVCQLEETWEPPIPKCNSGVKNGSFCYRNVPLKM